MADLVAELTARHAAHGDGAETPSGRDPAAVPPPEARPVPNGTPHDPEASDAAAPVEARPRIVDDSAILGLTRHSRSRVGSRLFTWFFVFVYAVIVIQLVVVLLQQA